MTVDEERVFIARISPESFIHTIYYIVMMGPLPQVMGLRREHDEIQLCVTASRSARAQ